MESYSSDLSPIAFFVKVFKILCSQNKMKNTGFTASPSKMTVLSKFLFHKSKKGQK
jgi:hypothetical protein